VMNAARAVVVTDQVGCQPDLIEDGVNGFVVPALNVDALAATLKRILENPSLAHAAGQRALEHISRFDFEEDVRGLRQALACCAPGFVA
jgi:glycosyltransferase involved in cell wall biosynthesis